MLISTRKTLWGGLGLAAIASISALTLAGCAGEDPNAASTKSQIVVSYTNEVTTIDPARADYVQSNGVEETLYDTLVGYDKDGEIIPRVAAEFSYNDAVDAVTITLRDDVAFHDGTTLTAKDVQWSLDRYKELGVGIFGMISTYDSTEVTSDTELTIHLTKPDPLFMGALSRVYIINSALAEENAGDDNAQSWLLGHDAGSGPFTLEDESSGTYTLARYDEYWDFDETRPERLILRRIDDLNTTQQELLAGNIDMGHIPMDDPEAVKDKGFALTDWAVPGAFIYFNTSKGATADPAVREAITYAFDYQQAQEKFRGDLGELADGPLLSTLACRPDLPEVSYDPDKAKQILADAGVENLTLTMRYQPAFDEQAKEATLLQSNLKDIGVTLKLEPIAFADYLTAIQKPDTTPEVFLSTDSAPYPDAGVVLAQQYSSQAKGTNRSAYDNPEFDKLLDEAAAEPDPDARCDIYKEAQVVLNDDHAVMPLYTAPMPMGVAPGITNYDAYAPNANPAFQEYRIEKK